MAAAVTTAIPTPGSGNHRPPPPRPKLPPAATLDPQRQQELGSSPQCPPSSGRPRPTEIPTSMRALQLLKETRPSPPRRQSVPISVPPRGVLARLQPLENNNEEIMGKLLGPNAVRKPHFTHKPPPPSSPPPMALIAAARRHSTGSEDRPHHGSVNISGGVRPPPPRGVPPSPLGPTILKGDSTGRLTSLPSGGLVRRRSSSLRAPPPGPPSPERRPSTALPEPAEIQADGTIPLEARAPQQQQQGQQQYAQGPHGRDLALLGDEGGIRKEKNGVVSLQQLRFEPNATRRVSFSTYRGPVCPENPSQSTGTPLRDKSDTPSRDNVNRSNVDMIDVASTRLSVGGRPSSTQLDPRWSSHLGGVAHHGGRPPPPRPPGDPPNEVRRYSIMSQLSNGIGDFSRRMSMVVPPAQTTGDSEGKSRPAPQADAKADGYHSESRRGSNISAFAGRPVDGVNDEQLQQREGPEVAGRAAVLWYNMGVTRQKERDAKGAVECYSRAAAEGHAKAQHNLAAIYERGAPDVRKDEYEAVRLFKLAADQGLAESCYSLAMHLKFGLGVEQNDGKCVYYLEKASEHGLAKAMFNLGLMYEKRRGVSPDAPESELLEATRECYQAAAEAGVTKAAVNIGALYLTGRIPGREPEEALEWFKKAADEGDLSGLWNLSLCYERGVGVARDPIAARALQQTCKEREKQQQQQQQQQQGRSGPPAGPAVAVALSRRRSSDPTAPYLYTKPPPSNTALREENHTAVNAESQDDFNNPAKNRRRSSSVPSVTPPPPQGPPPPHDADKPVGTHVPREAGPVVSKESGLEFRRGSNGYKYIPPRILKGATSAVDEEEGGGGVPICEGAGTEVGRGAGGVVIPPPLRQRKDSLLLKPTPLAIARVKAAVERKRAMEAAVNAKPSEA